MKLPSWLGGRRPEKVENVGVYITPFANGVVLGGKSGCVDLNMKPRLDIGSQLLKLLTGGLDYDNNLLQTLLELGEYKPRCVVTVSPEEKDAFTGYVELGDRRWRTKPVLGTLLAALGGGGVSKDYKGEKKLPAGLPVKMYDWNGLEPPKIPAEAPTGLGVPVKPRMVVGPLGPGFMLEGEGCIYLQTLNPNHTPTVAMVGTSMRRQMATEVRNLGADAVGAAAKAGLDAGALAQSFKNLESGDDFDLIAMMLDSGVSVTGLEIYGEAAPFPCPCPRSHEDKQLLNIDGGVAVMEQGDMTRSVRTGGSYTILLSQWAKNPRLVVRRADAKADGGQAEPSLVSVPPDMEEILRKMREQEKSE